MLNLAAVYGGSAPHHRALHAPKYARWLTKLVYLPDLPDSDLSRFDGVIVPERMHRAALQAARPRLLDVLDRGGTLVVFGEQSVYGEQPEGWLPGVAWEHRPTNYWWWLDPQAPRPLVAADPDHPLLAWAPLAQTTWHHHGVFWPPEHAETVIAARDGGSVLYLDRASTPGTLIAATLDPMYHFGAYFMPAAERFLDGFLPWLAQHLGNGGTDTSGSE